MSNGSKNLSRLLAIAALVVAALVIVVAVTGSLGGDDGSTAKSHRKSSNKKTVQGKNGSGKHKRAPAVYVVKEGDTLSSIAIKTGVSLTRIRVLNPHIDPQVLSTGQKLKLR